MNTDTEAPTRYEISTLRDIFLLPTKEQMVTCLIEMRALLEQSRSVSDLTAALAGLPEGEPSIIFPDSITWIDDGKGEIAPTYCADGKPVFTLHEVMASEEFNPTDTERLDWLESKSNGMPWIARESTTGRGFRLHNDQSGSFGSVYPTARDAIDAAMLGQEGAL